LPAGNAGRGQETDRSSAGRFRPAANGVKLEYEEGKEEGKKEDPKRHHDTEHPATADGGDP
jgi:hypothetical protein